MRRSTPILAANGYRVIVPYLRGYGTTRFLSDDTVRNGQQAALALDAVALLDALDDRVGGRRRLRLGRADAPTSSPRSGRNGAAAWSR